MTTAALDRSPHDHHDHLHDHDGPAAWVGDRRVEVAEVDAEVTRLREGPRAALLPVAESAEGRQLRRWVTQTLVARAVLEREAGLRGLGDGPPTAVVLPDRLAATTLGGVLASVLRSSGPARAVYADVTLGSAVTTTEALAYLERSTSAAPGQLVAPTDPQLADAQLADAQLAEASARLTAARARQVFLDWFSARTAELVRLEPGHEHPGDPHQPDATHRH